jgi:hypothetical protein
VVIMGSYQRQEVGVYLPQSLLSCNGGPASGFNIVITNIRRIHLRIHLLVDFKASTARPLLRDLFQGHTELLYSI